MRGKHQQQCIAGGYASSPSVVVYNADKILTLRYSKTTARPPACSRMHGTCCAECDSHLYLRVVQPAVSAADLLSIERIWQ